MVDRCKGMRDLSPEEMAVFRLINGMSRDCFSKWGYKEVRTPTIEYLHLFTSAGTLTPGKLGKVYSFLDWDGWSGERVVLRPDGTIPVARYYTDNLKDSGLARLSYATNIFIFEEDGEKPRERWQCGVELIGAGSDMADVELVVLSSEILNRLGLKNVELRLSHAGLTKTLLVKLGLSTEEQDKLFDRILDGDSEALADVTRGSPELEGVLQPILSLKGQSPGFLNNQKALITRDIPEAGPFFDDFLKTVHVLDDLGCDYRIDIASGAGFEYYTGMIFQLYIKDEKVGGGGRYDALIPSMRGGDVPAAGFALYVDRLMKLVDTAALVPPSQEKVLIKVEKGASVKEAFKLADSLRDTGFIAEFDLDGGETEARWVVEIKKESPVYTLINDTKSERLQAGTIDNLVNELRKQSGG